MSNLKITITVPIQELAGSVCPVPQPVITLTNHWNRMDLVVITFDKKGAVALSAVDLIKAIKACI
jgi:hypothetical protein